MQRKQMIVHTAVVCELASADQVYTNDVGGAAGVQLIASGTCGENGDHAVEHVVLDQKRERDPR